MRFFISLTFCFLAYSSYAVEGFGPTFAKDTENPYKEKPDEKKAESSELDSNKVENIYCAYGYTTHIKFQSKYKIQQITPGSQVITFAISPDQSGIDIFPQVTQGQTNLNVMINGITYVFVMHIVADDRIMFRRTFTIMSPTEDTTGIPKVSGPPVKPQDIDVVFYITAMEKTRTDATYNKAMQKTMQAFPLDKIYQWNGCAIHLIEAVQFPKDNLVVLKIEWQNLTDNALYLSADQYQVSVANQIIPVTAKSQLSSLLFPGQMDTVYLFIQGYGLSASNAFELALPPESSGVKQLLRGMQPN